MLLHQRLDFISGESLTLEDSLLTSLRDFSLSVWRAQVRAVQGQLEGLVRVLQAEHLGLDWEQVLVVERVQSREQAGQDYSERNQAVSQAQQQVSGTTPQG